MKGETGNFQPKIHSLEGKKKEKKRKKTQP